MSHDLEPLDPAKGAWDTKEMGRRRFLEVTFWSVTSVVTVGVVGSGGRFLVGNSLEPRTANWVQIGKVAELKERKLAVASRLERMVIKSPITGDVYQLAVHTVGGVIGPGEPLMLIVPEADELILQAQVMPQDIDKVRSGQIAHIRFPAFNSRLTPEVAAEVTQISADTSRIDASSPPFYSVRLMISATELAKLGDNKLKPGMPAEAFIQTEAQTPMTYFLKPLTDQFAHALREE